MRKILSITLVALLICLGATTCFAQGRSRIGEIRLVSSGVINQTHTHVTTSPALIYKIQFRANYNHSWAVVYDSNTTGASTTMDEYVNLLSAEGNGRVLADPGEATAGDWVKIDYDVPIYAKNGILAGSGSTDTAGGSTAIDAPGDAYAELIIHYTSAE